MRNELRLERRAKAEVNRLLTTLKEESKRLLASEHNDRDTEWEDLQWEIGQLLQKVDQKRNKRIANLQQLTDMHASEMSAL